MERQGLIRGNQHGFVYGKSHLTNLLSFIEEATKIDEDNGVYVVYMDTSKALDRIPPSRLIWKVRSYRIWGKLANWIQNWHSKWQRPGDWCGAEKPRDVDI